MAFLSSIYISTQAESR